MPADYVYDKLALQRVGKCWRHYKHTLKATNFKPGELKIVEHYDKIPLGISRGQWKSLVNFWFSEEGKKLSRHGKEARACRNQFHTTGALSFANKRADYEEEHDGEKMSMIELWEQAHKRKDGTFLEGTVTEDFLIDAKARVEMLKLRQSDGSKSTLEIENEAFQVELNGEEYIPERPQGYGFGVKKSDVYGVRGLLRMEGYGKSGKNSLNLDINAGVTSQLHKKNVELEKENKVLSKKVDVIMSQFSVLLGAISDGKASTQLVDVAKKALEMANTEVHNNVACDDDIVDDDAAYDDEENIGTETSSKRAQSTKNKHSSRKET